MLLEAGPDYTDIEQLPDELKLGHRQEAADPMPLKSLVMAPANRADFLFKAPAEGTYQIFGLPVPESKHGGDE